MVTLDKQKEELKILINTEELIERIKELGKELDNIIGLNEDVYMICVLKGSVMFCTELIKYMESNVQLEFIRVSSYGNEFHSSNKTEAIDLNLPDLKNKNVVIIEDIIDTGLTAKYIKDLLGEYKPKKLLFLSMLNKKCARKISIEPDLYGFEIDDKFVVGFGLDYKGYYRNLPYIGYFPN